MKLSELRSLKVLVWGGGREGAEAARVLAEQQCIIAFVTDTPNSDTSTSTLATEYQTVVLSPSDIASWNPDFIVRSPGVSRYRSELSGFPSSGLFALWLADQDLHRIIGVTGTKGKSTTSTLIARILTAAGHTVELAGNIGVPVTHTSPHTDFVVVEVSSYQASDCTVSPSIGVLTSLDVDHLPWHGSVEKYHQDKLNLFAHPQIQHMVFHVGHPLIDSSLRALNVDSKRFSNSQHSVHVALATPQGEDAIRRMGNTTFPKNLELAMDAALAADNSLTLAHVLTALENTSPLPSRQNIVGEAKQRIFVDDALASNPFGVIAAIERFSESRFILIMGGDDRHVDYSELCASINDSETLKAIVLLGDAASRLHKALLTTRASIHLAHSENVADATQIAATLSQPGDYIVFSPGAPTPPSTGDFQTRSAQFITGMKNFSLD